MGVEKIVQTRFSREEYLEAALMVVNLKEGNCHPDFFAIRHCVAESLIAMAEAPDEPRYVLALNGLQLFVYR